VLKKSSFKNRKTKIKEGGEREKTHALKDGHGPSFKGIEKGLSPFKQNNIFFIMRFWRVITSERLKSINVGLF
jgi:hypothetical protein